MEHAGDAEAGVQVCGPKGRVEAAIRAMLDAAFPFHPAIALSWPGLDPSLRLEEVLGVEARLPPEPKPLPAPVARLKAELEQDLSADFADDAMT